MAWDDWNNYWETEESQKNYLVWPTWWTDIYVIQKQFLGETYSFVIYIVHQMFCSKYVCAEIPTIFQNFKVPFDRVLLYSYHLQSKLP